MWISIVVEWNVETQRVSPSVPGVGQPPSCLEKGIYVGPVVSDAGQCQIVENFEFQSKEFVPYIDIRELLQAFMCGWALVLNLGLSLHVQCSAKNQPLGRVLVIFSLSILYKSFFSVKMPVEQCLDGKVVGGRRKQRSRSKHTNTNHRRGK